MMAHVPAASATGEQDAVCGKYQKKQIRLQASGLSRQLFSFGADFRRPSALRDSGRRQWRSSRKAADASQRKMPDGAPDYRMQYWFKEWRRHAAAIHLLPIRDRKGGGRWMQLGGRRGGHWSPLPALVLVQVLVISAPVARGRLRVRIADLATAVTAGPPMADVDSEGICCGAREGPVSSITYGYGRSNCQHGRAVAYPSG